MSSFFDLPPVPDDPSPPQTRYRAPSWQDAPPATIPAVVPVERVLARTDDVAVVLPALHVYPEGLELEIVCFTRPRAEETIDDGFDPLLFHHHASNRARVSDDVLRIGVQFADGRKGTNLAADHGWHRPPPTGLVFRAGGGGGGGDRYAQRFWLWPLPDEGPLSVVVEWPAHGIPLTRTEIDGDELRAAAARSQVVFSQDHLPEPPDEDPDGDGWASYVTPRV